MALCDDAARFGHNHVVSSTSSIVKGEAPALGKRDVAKVWYSKSGPPTGSTIGEAPRAELSVADCINMLGLNPTDWISKNPPTIGEPSRLRDFASPDFVVIEVGANEEIDGFESGFYLLRNVTVKETENRLRKLKHESAVQC